MEEKHLDIYAERFLKAVYSDALNVPMVLPVEEVARKLELTIEYANLEEGTHIMTIPRISGKPGHRYINWSPYIRLLADKPAAMYNFSFLDLFEGNDAIIERLQNLKQLNFRHSYIYLQT